MAWTPYAFGAARAALKTAKLTALTRQAAPKAKAPAKPATKRTPARKTSTK